MTEAKSPLDNGELEYVFTYGSLLDPGSLLRTLPEVDLETCVPGTCLGFRRSFTVAFPNDGSQSDKAYRDSAGHRPPVVLMADIVRTDDAKVNGICLPLGPKSIDDLKGRELRYDFVEVEVDLRVDRTIARQTVKTFVGKAKFIRPEDIARGVVSADYLESALRGAEFWDRRYPGFADEFGLTTDMPDQDLVRKLTRSDRTAENEEP